MELLQDHFKEYFERNPNVTCVRLCGYTPGFNDGDPCTFNMQDPMIYTGEPLESIEDYSGLEEDGSSSDESFVSSWGARKNESLTKAFNDDLLDIHESVITSILNPYGFRVFVTKDAIEVEDDYDCGY